jgi:hypothetical protein
MTDDWMVTTSDGSISAELPDGFNAEIRSDRLRRTRAQRLVLANLRRHPRQARVLRAVPGNGGKSSLRTGDGTIWNYY